MIGFNKPYLTGRELEYMAQAVASEKISGDGLFTRKCHEFFAARYGFKKTLLTTSCTDALELAALLCNIQPGDEVIAPAYTFVSTVNAFVLRGARIVFMDSRADEPCMDASTLSALVTPRTKAVVVVHYAGVAVDMDVVMEVAQSHGLWVVEDAAQAIDSYFRGRPLGSIGQLAAFSFHETKNIMSGEGGLLVVNDSRFSQRAEVLREKGTNRSAFFRGEIDKYNWVDVGSSFLPSDLLAAFLFAQLEHINALQERRKSIWAQYERALQPLKPLGVTLPTVPPYATQNGHLFYIVCRSLQERSDLIQYLKERGVQAVFHYLALHKSPFAKQQWPEVTFSCPNAERYSDCLVRLPLYYELTDAQVDQVVATVLDFYQRR